MPELAIVLKATGSIGADLQRARDDAKAKAQGIGTEIAAGMKPGLESINSVGNAFAEQAKRMQASMQAAGVDVGIFGKAVGFLVNPITLVGAAFAGLTLGAKAVIDTMVSVARETKMLMNVSGLTAEAADELGNTLSVLGIEVGAAQGAFFKMAQEIDSGGASLSRLGVQTRDAAGNLKTEGALFLEVRDRIAALGSAGERSAALIDVFGRSGRALAPAFQLSREEFIKLMQEAGKLSPWSDEAQKKTNEYIREVNKLHLAWEGLKVSLGTPIIGTVAMAVRFVTDTLTAKPEDLTRANVAGPQSARFAAQRAADEAQVANHAALLAAMAKDEEAFNAHVRDLQEGRGHAYELLTQDQLRLDQVLIEKRLRARLGALDVEDAAVRGAVAQGQRTQEEGLAAQLALLARRRHAEVAAVDEQLALIASKRAQDDQSHTKEVALLTERQKVIAAYAKQEIDLTAQLRATELARFKDVAEAAVRAAMTQTEADLAYAAQRQAIGEQLLDLYRTEEERAIAAENEKARVAIEKAFEVLGETEAAHELGLRLLEIRDQKIKAIRDRASASEAEAQAKALERMFQLTESDTARTEREYRDRFNFLDMLRANELLSAAAFQEAVRRLREDAAIKHVQGIEQEQQRSFDSLQAQQREAGHYFGFLVTGFQRAAEQARNVWATLAQLSKDIFAGMSRSLSDVFFNVFTGQATKMADVFKGVMQSMLRALSDFMANQIVGRFLSFLLGSGFATGGTAGFGFFGGGTGRPGAGDVLPGLFRPGETVLTGEQTGLVGNLVKLFSGGAPTLGTGGQIVEGASGFADAFSSLNQFFANPGATLANASDAIKAQVVKVVNAVTGLGADVAGNFAAGDSIGQGIFNVLFGQSAATQGAEAAIGGLGGQATRGIFGSGGSLNASGLVGGLASAGVGAGIGAILTQLGLDAAPSAAISTFAAAITSSAAAATAASGAAADAGLAAGVIAAPILAGVIGLLTRKSTHDLSPVQRAQRMTEANVFSVNDALLRGLSDPSSIDARLAELSRIRDFAPSASIANAAFEQLKNFQSAFRLRDELPKLFGGPDDKAARAAYDNLSQALSQAVGRANRTLQEQSILKGIAELFGEDRSTGTVRNLFDLGRRTTQQVLFTPGAVPHILGASADQLHVSPAALEQAQQGFIAILKRFAPPNAVTDAAGTFVGRSGETAQNLFQAMQAAGVTDPNALFAPPPAAPPGSIVLGDGTVVNASDFATGSAARGGRVRAGAGIDDVLLRVSRDETIVPRTFRDEFPALERALATGGLRRAVGGDGISVTVNVTATDVEVADQRYWDRVGRMAARGIAKAQASVGRVR